MTPEQIRNSWDDDEPSTPQEPRGAILPAPKPVRGFSDADLLRRRTAALNRTSAENERLRAEVERLREDKATFERWRDQWILTADERETVIAREEDRADAAEAKLEKARAYAKEREAYGKRGRTVHSARVASDLLAVLARSQAPQAPAEQEGYVEWDRGKELADEFVAKDQSLTEADIRAGRGVAKALAPNVDLTMGTPKADVEPLERLIGHLRAVLAQAHDAQDVSETHHRNCYQTRGVPDDLPQDLCDCRILWMIDGHAFGERTQRITEWGIQIAGGNVLQINTVPIAEEVRDSQIKAMAAAGKAGDLVSRVRVHTEDDVSEWEAKR